MNHAHFYTLALTMIPGVGPVHARNLLNAFNHDAQSVFKASATALQKIDGIGPALSHAIKNFRAFDQTEAEINFALKNNIEIISIQNESYPSRLRNCHDAPLLLFYKGNVPLNHSNIVAVIGTRNLTTYGAAVCEKLIKELPQDTLVLSGLAAGTDSEAHRCALKYHLPTIAVLGHGLDRIYPPENKMLAKKIMHNGGLLTDFISGTKPDKENFPKRNRIVAGMSDAVVVVESDVSGGSVITAWMAQQYNRDVFAFPGRTSDRFSAGCNALIRDKKATLITGAQDLLHFMQWKNTITKPVLQRNLFSELNHQEQKIVDLIKDQTVHLDNLYNAGFTPSELSGLLLQLELKGVVQALPGKTYKLTDF